VPTRVAHYKLAEIGGDGIGPDVMAEAVRVLDAGAGDGLHVSFPAAAGDRIEAAVAKALQEPEARTRDIGDNATTRAAGEVVIRAL
jgi:isocitrate/isopropylmalate dehydrogenase